MFYCEGCRRKNEWPKSAMVCRGPCEVCNIKADCYDIPSSALPMPKASKTLKVLDLSKPDDIRQRGWMVAVHNDYKLKGEPYTFWLFTKGLLFAKGEGKTDREALDQVRACITIDPVITVTVMLQELTARQRTSVFFCFCTQCGADDGACKCTPANEDE